MKIKIKNKEVELKQTFRTLMLFENIANETFAASGSISSVLLYFYCNILACMETPDLTFDEFMDEIDKDAKLLNTYVEWLNKQELIQNVLKKKTDTIEKKTRKK